MSDKILRCRTCSYEITGTSDGLECPSCHHKMYIVDEDELAFLVQKILNPAQVLALQWTEINEKLDYATKSSDNTVHPTTSRVLQRFHLARPNYWHGRGYITLTLSGQRAAELSHELLSIEYPLSERESAL